ncbi:MAG TPA: zinc-binding dehydrogenase [Stellaceae bacterium]|jgi:NADPH:quinone reductase-like Zn-dependent oxidoreductase|nr:zinc-binding dehydrogenase [Stellaceae bacterium]
MKAIVIREFGGPEVMRVEEVPTPDPGPGEVLVQVAAVSVNRTLDIIVRNGKYARPVKLPHVLGVDPTGTVVATGPGVKNRKLGDRICISSRRVVRKPGEPMHMLGIDSWGGYAQYVALNEDVTALVPDGMDYPTACIVARHAPLAFNQVRSKAQLKEGDWALVMGAAGGLGSIIVQAAAVYGANIIAAAGADERVEAAKKLGAQHGINYRTHNLTEEVKRITGGRGVDVVFENIADPELFPKALASLRRGGKLFTAGAHAGPIVPLNVSTLYMNEISIIAGTGHTNEDVAAALDAAAHGKLTMLIDRVMPLSQAAEAHRLVESRKITGKVLLTPDEALG